MQKVVEDISVGATNKANRTLEEAGKAVMEDLTMVEHVNLRQLVVTLALRLGVQEVAQESSSLCLTSVPVRSKAV